MKPTIIFFAAVPSTGKTRMAHYLSEQFGLPIFSTDAIRYDTKVSQNVTDINDALEEFDKTRDARANAMVAKKKSFIYDGSVDRRWSEVKKKAEDAGFQWVLISFDISRNQIMKFRKMFDRVENDELFEKWIDDHEKFRTQFGSDAKVHITDGNYSQRYQLATEAVAEVLGK